MSTRLRRTLALAALAGAVAVTSATAQDGKKPADEKKPADPPKGGQVGPPPELAELRAAVEAAAKKGENVDDIRAKLDALEKAMTGRAWAKPKAVPAPADDVPVRPNPAPRFDFQPRGNNPNLLPPLGGGLLPNLGGNDLLGGLGMAQPDNELVQKAQKLMQKALELAAQDPPDAEKAAALEKEAQELLLQALLAQGAGGRLGGLGGFPGLGGGLPNQPKPRLGVSVQGADDGPGVVVKEVVAGSVAEKAGLKEGDLIVEFAGKEVPADSAAFVRMVQGAKGGEKLGLAYIRGGKKTVKDVELAK